MTISMVVIEAIEGTKATECMVDIIVAVIITVIVMKFWPYELAFGQMKTIRPALMATLVADLFAAVVSSPIRNVFLK
jgi:hypothetical protein